MNRRGRRLSLLRDRLCQHLDAVVERSKPCLDAHEQERRHRHREPEISDQRKKVLHALTSLGDVKLLAGIEPSLLGHVTGKATGNLYTFSP